MRLDEALMQVKPLDERAMAAARNRWNTVAKPIGSLGVLEDLVVRMAGIIGDHRVDISRRVVVACCADNGVVAEGVTQTGQEITALVAKNMLHKISSVCRMGAVAGIEVVPVDVGMAQAVPGVLDYCVARGTGNIAQGPAMTRDQAVQAIEAGIEVAGRMKADGFQLLIAAEMGIGNTTTSSAMGAVLLNLPVAEVTGRGAGLSSDGLARKIHAIQRAIDINEPDPYDPIDVLAKVGGFDIAALAGLFIGGAIYRIPVLVDGCISAVGALVAARLCPECVSFMIATHASAEPVFAGVMEVLGLSPIIHAGMRLGEGTGAVCLVPVLDMALALYSQGDSFDELGMDAYEVDLV